MDWQPAAGVDIFDVLGNLFHVRMGNWEYRM